MIQKNNEAPKPFHGCSLGCEESGACFVQPMRNAIASAAVGNATELQQQLDTDTTPQEYLVDRSDFLKNAEKILALCSLEQAAAPTKDY